VGQWGAFVRLPSFPDKIANCCGHSCDAARPPPAGRRRRACVLDLRNRIGLAGQGRNRRLPWLADQSIRSEYYTVVAHSARGARAESSSESESASLTAVCPTTHPSRVVRHVSRSAYIAWSAVPFSNLYYKLCRTCMVQLLLIRTGSSLPQARQPSPGGRCSQIPP